jgi:hypothetical protein
VSLRRIVIAATTIAVALALSILVPIAQLQTVADKPACWCPEHKPASPFDTTMRACHNSAPDLVQTQLPQFVSPALPSVMVPSEIVAIVATRLPAPHPAPAPRRPDAPS